MTIDPLNWLHRLWQRVEVPLLVLPPGVERCIYHVIRSARSTEVDLQLHLCQRHMATAARRNATLVPFPTRSCTLGCQECLREALN